MNYLAANNCILLETMTKFYLLFLMAGICNLHGFAQTAEIEIPRADYLTFQTGLIQNGYNSLGIRTYFDYQKDLKKNWQWGISYEHDQHFGHLWSDVRNLETNVSLLSLNGYYKLQLVRDKFFFTAGLGIGAAHVNWDNQNDFGLTANVSLTMNIRLSKRIYLESAPFFVLLPSNRVYYSPMNVEEFSDFWAFTLFPIGIKVKL